MDKNTICVHSGTFIDSEMKGRTTPIYPSTSYAYLDMEQKRYPRYFNIPNQGAVVKKVAQLEGAETGVLFGSGMAAISTAMLSQVRQGDHVILQKELYGGTIAFVQSELPRCGVEYTFTEGMEVADFEAAIRPNTRLIHIETPSNPLLTLVDIEAIAQLAKDHGITTMIDNTFASPINQQPHRLGIDIVIHSATKYLGGHSDICAGIALCSGQKVETIHLAAKNFGGSINAQSASLLERSLKTLNLRVQQQNHNAQYLAEALAAHEMIQHVYYPGLASHPQHELARKQMQGFGGMLTFELAEGIDNQAYQEALKLVSPSMSLGGVESTVCSPALTSHAAIDEATRQAMGISNQMLRFSVGIEDAPDLLADLNQAFQMVAMAHA